MKCGKAVKFDGTAVEAGFANPGRSVFVAIKKGTQIVKWTKITDTMDEDGNFTVDLDGIDLSGSDVKVLLYSVKPADKAGTTGATGLTGSF